MKNILLTAIVITGFLCGQSQEARAQILVNGDFEADSATIGTGKITNGFSEISGWEDINAAANNSGVQFGTPGAGLNNSQSGDYFAFQDSDDSSGVNSNKGAFQITSTVLQAGDQVTLTWYAANTFGNPIQNVDLLSAGTTGASFNSASILTPSNDPVLTLGGTYAEYTLAYTATAADAGKYLGVSFSTTGVNNSFVQYDNFVVQDISETPEPATYALLLMGLSGVLAIGRVRRGWAGVAAIRKTKLIYEKQPTLAPRCHLRLPRSE
jgi:hypothetical protein